MAQIGNVPEVNAVKQKLSLLKDKGLIKEWELPYENILTRLSAAIFFLTPADESKVEEIWDAFKDNDTFHYILNEEKKLSLLEWRIEFNKKVA